MAAIILISVGVLFNIFGCLGLIRLPDVYNRLQAATKCVTQDAAAFFLGVLVHFGIGGAGFRALVAIPILFFTATVAAHALVRGAYHFGAKLDKRSVKDDYREEVK
ncbi:MAG: monovalent cation/H(+) antiporter subunit G [Bacteroidales bacterium]